MRKIARAFCMLFALLVDLYRNDCERVLRELHEWEKTSEPDGSIRD